MAYVDGFEHDIFLSYARVDDQAAKGEREWVSAFEDHLRVALNGRAGRIGAVNVWRDLRGIAGNQLFDRTIEDALDSSAVFVALTSSGYLTSEYCQREVTYFHRRAAGDRFGLAVGDRLRIVNVLLTDVNSGNWPPEFDRTGGFDVHDGERQEEAGLPSEPGSPLFKKQLRALVGGIYGLLEAMQDIARPASSLAKGTKGTVYLADVSDTLRAQLRNLTDDLKRHEIKVVLSSPYEQAGYDRRVIRALEGADLSVHLLDANAGYEVEGRKDLIYPWRQVELAGDHARSRMIWLPRDLDLAMIDDDAYRGFLLRLEREDAGDGTSDFIRCVRADLTGLILEKVEFLRTGLAGTDGEGASCLLVTHPKDTAHMLPVAGTLVDEGIEPAINQEPNEPKLALDLFKHRLREVASLVIFYGSVRRKWVRERLDTAIKIGALEKLDLRLGVFAAPPEKPPADLSFSRGFARVETLATPGDVLEFVGGGS